MGEKNNDMLEVVETLVVMNGGESVMTLTARDIYYWIKMILKDSGSGMTKTSFDENSLLNFLDTYYTLSGSRLSAEDKETYKKAYDYVNNHYSCIYTNENDPRIKTCSEFFIKRAAVVLNHVLICCMYNLKYAFGKEFADQHDREFSTISDILHNSDATYGSIFSADDLCSFLDECQKKIKGIINEEIECIDRIKHYITDHYCYISTDAEGGFTVHLPDNLFNPNLEDAEMGNAKTENKFDTNSYVKGQDDYWELIKKIYNMTPAERVQAFSSTANIEDILIYYRPACIISMYEKWLDTFEIGLYDEVEVGDSSRFGWVINIDTSTPNKAVYTVMFSDRSVNTFYKNFLRRTGNTNMALGELFTQLKKLDDERGKKDE